MKHRIGQIVEVINPPALDTSGFVKITSYNPEDSNPYKVSDIDPNNESFPEDSYAEKDLRPVVSKKSKARLDIELKKISEEV